MEPTVVRVSNLPWYPDCPRRAASRMFRREIEAAGFVVRDEPRGIGAAVGIAVHKSGAMMLAEKAKSGSLPSASLASDVAVETVREEAKRGVIYDARVTPSFGDAQQQVARMARSYHGNIAPTIEPILVEERLEAQISPAIVVSGQPDALGLEPGIVARERGRVHDTKTGTRLGNYAAQVGGYSLLARTPSERHPNGIDIQEAGIDWVPRVSMKKEQPPPVVHLFDIAAAEGAATNILRHIEDDLRTFREGDDRRRILPGDPWAFPANPQSVLCGSKFCGCWGGRGPHAFCREWLDEGEPE